MGNGRKYSDELNDEIRFIRKQYPKLSQAKIAKRLDCSQTYVSRVLNNYSKHNSDTIEDIPDLASTLITTLSKLKTMPTDAYISNAITRNVKLLYQIMKENKALRKIDEYEAKLQNWPTYKLQAFQNLLVNDKEIDQSHPLTSPDFTQFLSSFTNTELRTKMRELLVTYGGLADNEEAGSEDGH